ncbi:MAG: type IV secretion system protein VirJ, partial [Sphingomonadales bacterium]|nr:type IV secretion system protein VirJ [Sphingomonadales bacterium]
GWFGGTVLTTYRSTRPAALPRAAVYLSSDVGPVLGLSSGIIETLRGEGFAVVAVNSATYFNRERRPEEVVRLVNTAVRQAAALGGTSRVVLIGHSFGADMLHVALARMPPADRAKIAAAVLVAPGKTIEFRVSPLEMLGLSGVGQDAMPTARAAGFVPITCIYGQDEAESLCPDLRLAGLQLIALPGGHNLRFDSAALGGAMRNALTFGPTHSSFGVHGESDQALP